MKTVVKITEAAGKIYVVPADPSTGEYQIRLAKLITEPGQAKRDSRIVNTIDTVISIDCVAVLV
jgi:hypothetical protein